MSTKEVLGLPNSDLVPGVYEGAHTTALIVFALFFFYFVLFIYFFFYFCCLLDCAHLCMCDFGDRGTEVVGRFDRSC